VKGGTGFIYFTGRKTKVSSCYPAIHFWNSLIEILHGNYLLCCKCWSFISMEIEYKFIFSQTDCPEWRGGIIIILMNKVNFKLKNLLNGLQDYTSKFIFLLPKDTKDIIIPSHYRH
jgi:hypothetical protein